MIDFIVERSGEPCPAADRQRLLADPGFGRVFTDHMIIIDWTHEQCAALLGIQYGREADRYGWVHKVEH